MICKWCFKTKEEHQLEYSWTPRYFCQKNSITYRKFEPMDNLDYIEWLAEKRGINVSEVCWCKHSKEVHVWDTDDSIDYECYSCPYPHRWHEFQMDNLNTIEYLAEKRGLIK